LLWIICNIQAKAKNGVAEMTIRALDNLWLLHVWLKWAEHDLQTPVIELMIELLELRPFLLSFTCYKTGRGGMREY
jgi:hypothetical protein